MGFLSSGFVDIARHLNTKPGEIEIVAFERQAPASRDNLDAIPMRHHPTHFLHPFAGDSEPAMDAYVGLRGAEPDVEPLRRDRGFIGTDG